MKKNISLVLILILLFSVGVSAYANTGINVILDGDFIDFEVGPQIIDGRTMVPIRAMFEKMGAAVIWSAETNSAICKKGDTVVCMTLNDKNMYINNQKIVMDASPVVVDGRILAPARYVAEAFGADVQWDDSAGTVIISTADVTLYSLDGRTLNLPAREVEAHLKVGWYRTLEETQQTMYALDGRTLTVFKAEVSAYRKVGWYETIEETQQVMYAPDGRTITVFKAEVPAYKKVGWYETQKEAQDVFLGKYYYRTPTGKRYHLDPDCGGKNSTKTTNISGLTPCAKCAK